MILIAGGTNSHCFENNRPTGGPNSHCFENNRPMGLPSVVNGLGSLIIQDIAQSHSLFMSIHTPLTMGGLVNNATGVPLP